MASTLTLPSVFVEWNEAPKRVHRRRTRTEVGERWRFPRHLRGIGPTVSAKLSISHRFLCVFLILARTPRHTLILGGERQSGPGRPPIRPIRVIQIRTCYWRSNTPLGQRPGEYVQRLALWIAWTQQFTVGDRPTRTCNCLHICAGCRRGPRQMSCHRATSSPSKLSDASVVAFLWGCGDWGLLHTRHTPVEQGGGQKQKVVARNKRS